MMVTYLIVVWGLACHANQSLKGQADATVSDDNLFIVFLYFYVKNGPDSTYISSIVGKDVPQLENLRIENVVHLYVCQFCLP